MTFIMTFFGQLIFIYMLFVTLSYGLMLVIAFFDLRRKYKLDKSEIDEDTIDLFFSKPISILVPAYNEETGIIDSVQSLLGLRYPQTEIIIINDGSKDKTQEIAISQFRMVKVDREFNQRLPTRRVLNIYQSSVHPHLWLVEKENGGKADALNAGINLSRYPYFCSIDADSILEDNSLLRAMKPIIATNGDVIAVGGNIRIANGQDVQLGSIFQKGLPDNALVVMQMVEYIRSFLVGRIGLSKFNLGLIISGAFSIFQKQPVIEVGGYSVGMIGEDMELVVKIQRYIKDNKLGKRVEYSSDPSCWTEAPQTLRVLGRQRRRWHQGLLDSLWKHKGMTLNPKYGAIGMISFVYYWLVEALGPIIELGGYVYVIAAYFTGGIYVEYALLLSLLFIFNGMFFSTASVLLEAWSMDKYPSVKDSFKLMFISLTEPFWYRPLTLIWRFQGFINSLLRRQRWGNMGRQGLSGGRT